MVASTDKRVYVYLKDNDAIRQFLQKAEEEGYIVGKKKPTGAEPDSFFAVNSDMTVNYLNSIGHMAFQCNAPSIARIDYSKYISGEDDFFVH